MLAAHSHVTSQQAAASASLVARAQSALGALNRLRGDIIDVESAARTYTLRTNAATQESLLVAIARSATSVTAARQFTLNDTLQQRALADVASLLSHSLPPSTETRSGQRQSRDARRRIDALSVEQQGVLDAGMMRSSRDVRRAMAARRLVFAVSLLVLLSALWLLSRALTRKRFEEQRETFFDVSLDMLAFVGFDGYFKRLNPAWERTLGYSIVELMAKPQMEFIHPDDRAATRRQGYAVLAGRSAVSFENRFRCKDGSYKWLLWNAVPNKEHQLIYAVARDLTERKRAEAQLRELSLRDDMTNLRNRRGFMLLAEQELKLVRDRRRGTPDIYLWLIFADLDGLKGINDRLGHDAGSRAIVQASDILKSSFRGADIIARMGGDEFAVLAITNEPNGGTTMVDRLQTGLRRFNVEEQLPYELALSVGVVRVDPERIGSIDEVLTEADRRMYAHKRRDRRTPAVDVA